MLVQIAGNLFDVRLAEAAGGTASSAGVNGKDVPFVLEALSGNEGALRIGDRRYPFRIEPAPDGRAGLLRIARHALPYALEAPGSARAGPAALRGGTDPVVRCHMPGLLVRFSVKEGDAVKPGDLVAVLEAMKMQNEIRAKLAGRVRKLHAAPGATLEAGSPLVTLDPL